MCNFILKRQFSFSVRFNHLTLREQYPRRWWPINDVDDNWIGWKRATETSVKRWGQIVVVDFMNRIESMAFTIKKVVVLLYNSLNDEAFPSKVFQSLSSHNPSNTPILIWTKCCINYFNLTESHPIALILLNRIKLWSPLIISIIQKRWEIQ